MKVLLKIKKIEGKIKEKIRQFKANLFDENGKYTSDGVELDKVIEKALNPIFKEWRQRGYSFRDISHTTMLAVIGMESTLILREAARISKEKRRREEIRCYGLSHLY